MTNSQKVGATLVLVGLAASGLAMSDWNPGISSSHRIDALEARLAELESAIIALSESEPDVIREQIVREVSKEDELTEAVERAAPAVVSIVVTKDVPKLEVVYVNPFGNDPFFRDFNVRIPQYRQRGTVEQQVGAGTGFIVSTSGYIVTNRHVVEDDTARYTALLSDGSQKEATVVHRDDTVDFAIVKIGGGSFIPVPLGDSSTLKLGQTVFAVGNALGEYSNTVSVGIISGLDRNLEAQGATGVVRLEGVIQTDAAINPGNSGGPLVNLRGEVVGVNVATALGAENISFSIPLNDVRDIMGRFIPSSS